MQAQVNDKNSHDTKEGNTRVIQVYAPTGNAKEAEAEWFYEDL